MSWMIPSNAITDALSVRRPTRHLESVRHIISLYPNETAIDRPDFSAIASAIRADATNRREDDPLNLVLPYESVDSHPNPPSQDELFHAASE